MKIEKDIWLGIMLVTFKAKFICTASQVCI